MKADLSHNARTVLRHRYLRKDDRGRVIETPEEMFHRVACNIAEAERPFRPVEPKASTVDKVSRTARTFERLMTQQIFLPNSPTLMNAGRELQQLSACFVLPIEDSLESIFEAVKRTALIHQSGGGTGFSFSRLRPKNDRVHTTAGVASGPVSFLRVFNMATEVIKQGGTRRGANMGILRVDHPDIIEFITVKSNPAELTNFNLSVAVTDAFMKAAARGASYDLISPRTGHRVDRLNAAEVFNRIVQEAWRSGEPGLVFIDRINRDNPTPKLGMIEATNPCGEQPLLPYESCNLGSINLSRLVTRRGGRWVLNRDRLVDTVRLGIRFLDDVIEVNRYPLPEIDRITRGNRKIGLGVMGLADLFLLLEIPYDSEEALKLAEDLMALIRATAWETSRELARERGAFPNFSGSALEAAGMAPVRQATVTTIAPTGTLSIIAGCSSGIEPLYGICYIRTALDSVPLIEVHSLFLRMAKRGKFYSNRLMRTLRATGSLRDLPDVPQEIRRLFVTAHDISPEFHVRMQAAFQRHTDNAVSKTINFPKEAGPEDVRRAFLLAHREGCKGITIYRSGSRERQVLACTDPQYC